MKIDREFFASEGKKKNHEPPPRSLMSSFLPPSPLGWLACLTLLAQGERRERRKELVKFFVPQVFSFSCLRGSLSTCPSHTHARKQPGRNCSRAGVSNLFQFNSHQKREFTIWYYAKKRKKITPDCISTCVLHTQFCIP